MANLNTNIWRVYFHVRPRCVPHPASCVFYFSVFRGHVEASVVIHFSNNDPQLSPLAVAWLSPLPFGFHSQANPINAAINTM